MPNYSSNREILIRTSESGSFSFESSSLSNTKPIICKYIETLPNKLIDSTFTKNVSYITHNTVNMNLDYIFDYVSKLPFTVIYNIYDNIDILQNLAFDNCNTLKSIILPEGLTNIGKFSFNGCSNLKSIILPKSIKEIDNQLYQKYGLLEDEVNFIEKHIKELNILLSVGVTLLYSTIIIWLYLVAGIVKESYQIFILSILRLYLGLKLNLVEILLLHVIPIVQ